MLMDTVKDNDERRSSQPMNGVMQSQAGGPGGNLRVEAASGSGSGGAGGHRSRKGRGEEVHYQAAAPAYRQQVVDPGTPYPANQSAPRPAGSLGQVRRYIVFSPLCE